MGKITLPSPKKKREKEYVIGDNNNGGIERYKSEKHGKGLSECGLLGFVEDKDFKHWNNTINSWIDDLSKLPKTAWKSDEVLSKGKFRKYWTLSHKKFN